MTVESEDYKLEILEYAVNQSIDRLLPKSSEDALSVILNRSNEVVWRVATEIYTKSGYQVDFLFVKNVLNLRIEPLRMKVAEEKRIKAELEIQNRIREAEEEKIRKQKEIEEAKIRKQKEIEEAKIKEKLKAQRLAIKTEEANIVANLEAKRLAKIAEQEKIEKARKELERKKLHEFKEANPGIHINDYEELKTFLAVFERIKNVIVEQLDVNGEEIDKEKIKLHTILTKDLGVEDKYDNWCGYYERIELAMAIGEEFDINISDEEEETILSLSISQLLNLVIQKGGY